MEGEGDEEKGAAKESKSMAPWEQHSAVINMPRFDYKAPSSLLQRPHSGFLITCTLKREKSATKEAISILGKYFGSSYNCSSKSSVCSDANGATKRRKTCAGEIDGEFTNGAEGNTATANSEESVNVNGEITNSAKGISTTANLGDSGELLKDPANTDLTSGRGLDLSLVKLTRSGLVLFTFSGNNVPDTVDIVSNIVRSIGSGSLGSPLWCHRIFPIQSTCMLDEKELHAVVARLVAQFVNNSHNKLAHPAKFAVGYNRRGIEETEMKNSKNKPAEESNKLSLLDRNKCFAAAAAAVKEVIPDSVVDLRTPEFSVLVEFLPLSGVPNGSLVVAVSVLPHDLISTKPRLCIKALISDAKS